MMSTVGVVWSFTLIQTLGWKGLSLKMTGQNRTYPYKLEKEEGSWIGTSILFLVTKQVHFNYQKKKNNSISLSRSHWGGIKAFWCGYSFMLWKIFIALLSLCDIIMVERWSWVGETQLWKQKERRVNTVLKRALEVCFSFILISVSLHTQSIYNNILDMYIYSKEMFVLRRF